jgi:hypothetical protein
MGSDRTVGVVMIAMGVLSVSPLGQRHVIGVVPWVIAALLIATGAGLFLRRVATYWLAVGAAGLCALSGLLPFIGRPDLALPVPGWLSIVVGLYLLLRLFIAKRALTPRKAPPPAEEA